MRGVELVGTPLTSVNKVLATGDAVRVFNGFGSTLLPVKVTPRIAPGELKRLQGIKKVLVLEMEAVLSGLKRLLPHYPSLTEDVAMLNRGIDELSRNPSRGVVADLRGAPVGDCNVALSGARCGARRGGPKE